MATACATIARAARASAELTTRLVLETKTAPVKAGAVLASKELGLADGGAEIGAAIRHRLHDHLGADVDPRVEVGNVFIGEAQAAGGNVGADRLRSVGAMDAIDGAAEIHRAGAERVAGAAGHVARQIGLALDHFRGRGPGRPFGLPRNGLGAGPGEAVAADA